MNLRLVPFLLLAAMFLTVLIQDLRKGSLNSTEVVGHVEFVQGTVRRLAKNEYTWQRVSKGRELAAFDTISTGENATARIFLSRGGVLDLEPGSMVVLRPDLEQIQLSFVMGTGRVRVAEVDRSRVKIVGETKEQVQPKVEVVKVLANEPVMASSVEGLGLTKLDLRKKEQSLGSGGELLSMADLPPTPILTFPSNEATVDLSENREVHELRWEVPKPEKSSVPTVFELSLKTEGRSKSENSARVFRLNRRNFSLKGLPTGKYSWSVRSVAQSGSRSPASSLYSVEVLAPANVSTPRVLPVKVQ